MYIIRGKTEFGCTCIIRTKKNELAVIFTLKTTCYLQGDVEMNWNFIHTIIFLTLIFFLSCDFILYSNTSWLSMNCSPGLPFADNRGIHILKDEMILYQYVCQVSNKLSFHNMTLGGGGCKLPFSVTFSCNRKKSYNYRKYEKIK